PIFRPKIAPVHVAAEQRLTYEDKAVTSSPKLFITWPTVSVHSPDRYALTVLASVLSRGRTSRLTKELVYDRQLAASVLAGQTTLEDVGQLDIQITPRPGTSLTQPELVADCL